ncbi:neuroblast differentiation-associated protein AHNAK [Parambassis ranga]|uniref:Neuroblast differentiation-associated protein AHNAK n=1 Tax=Parambassis ranga TaxID=210632 RepID=A0A6P7HCN1_9TELE|nr:neuroblast differentiation-associated protein AHNAK-like [Parambassis ranga]
MCDCFHLAFPNWHAASSGTGAGRRLRGPEAATEDDSICDEPSQFTEGERPRPQGSSPVEEYPEKYTDSDKECEAEYDPQTKSGSAKKNKKSGLGSMFERRSTPKMSKLKEVHSPESGVIVKTAKDGCAEGLIYGGGGKEGIFIKEVVPESPASKSLKLKEGDQILSATVYFDNVSYDDAIQILEHAQAYKLKLCLKREPAIDSDVIPEEEVCTTDMREQGKTKRRGEARISWPKFPSFGKGRKSRFTRSHSSSEADEQRKLELSPTTSDTESPIKSQDALKGKKKHKMKLSALTKRGRISSSEDQETDAPTTGQISGDINLTQESDMLSPECLESPSGETTQIYVTENLKVIEDVRLEQNNQTLTEAQTVQHKVELISIGGTLKTADLTEALADQESPSGVKSPDGKKKKKERSELKMKILGKDKSHKKEKAKSSPKRLKTLGASFEIADQAEAEKTIPCSESTTRLPGDQHEPTKITSTESSKIKTLTTQVEMSVPKVEFDIPDISIRKSLQRDKDVKQKQETKAGTTFKLPKVGLGDISTEKTVQKVQVDVDERKPKIQQLTTEGTEVKGEPYERLSKSSVSQLPKREDIEIPGMEDIKITAKGIKEPKAVCTGSYEEIQSETVQLSIDVDSVKEAVSKLPGFKLPKVDTSGVLIPEEITVIDANAQRISVKTPTKVVDTKTKHEEQSRFGITPSPEMSKTTIKLPKLTADLTSEELLSETKVDLKKTQKEHKTKPKQSSKEMKTETSKREHIIIPGKDVSILQVQETEGEYESAATQDTDKKSKKAKITMSSFGIAKPDIRIPDIGFDFPKQRSSEQKVDAVNGENATLPEEVKMSKMEMRKAKGQTGGVVCEVNIPDIDGIAYIDSGDGSPAKKDSGITLQGFDVSLDAKVQAEEHTGTLPKTWAVAPDTSVNVPSGAQDVTIDGAEIKSPEREGKSGKFKIPNLGISMPKVKGPKIDLSLTKKDGAVTLQEAKAEVKLPEAPKTDITLGTVDVSIPQQKPELDIKPLETEGELEGQGTKFKMPTFEMKMPKIKGPELDLSSSRKDKDVKLPEVKAEVKLPEASETEVTLGSISVSIPEQKMEVEKPELEVKPLETEGELGGQGTKFKMPKFGIKMPKIKGPELDISLPRKDKDVKLPEAKAEVKLPDATDTEVTLGSVDVSVSEQRMKAEKPDMEIKSLETEGELEGQGTKFKMPKFGIKMPKIKGPELDLSLSRKDADVKLPEGKAEVKLPKAPDTDVTLGTIDVALLEQKMDLEKPELEVKPLEIEGELEGQGTKFKMPKFGIKMPKIKGPELDLSSSRKDADVKLPEGKTEVKLPEAPDTDVTLGSISVSIPQQKMETEKPELEVKPLETEGELNVQGSKFKMPKFGIKMPKIKGPDLDLSLSRKDADVKLPEAKAGIKFPEASKGDVVLGSVDVSISHQKMEVEEPNLEIKPMETDGEVEGQGIKFKMPKLGITMPKVKFPDAEHKESDNKQDVKSPKTAIQQDVEGSGSKFKMPTFKLPKLEVATAHISVEKPDMNKDIKIDGGDINIPEEGSAVNIAVSSFEVEGPTIDVKTTGTEHEGKGSKFKMPHLGFSVPKVKGPKIDLSTSKKDADIKLPDTKADVKLPEVDLGTIDVSIPAATLEDKKPELELQAPQTEGQMDGQGAKLKMPKFGVQIPKIKGPEIDFSLSKKDGDCTSQTKIETELPEAPKIDVSVGKAEVTIPEIEKDKVELEEQETKFKMPKFGMSMPKVKGPEFHLGFSKKDADVTGPDAKADIHLPDVELKAPPTEVEIQAPEIEAGVKGSEGSSLAFKMPSFSFSLPKGKGPDIDASLTKKDTDITLPQTEAKVKLPDASKIDVSLGKARVLIPETKVELKQPEVEIKPWETDGELDGQGSKFKMPKFGVSMPKVKAPEINLNLTKKDVMLPEAKVEVNLPDVELKEHSTNVETSVPEMQAQLGGNLEGPSSKFKLPTFKFPKFGASVSVGAPDIEKEIQALPEADLSLSEKDVNVELPEAKAKVKLHVTPTIDVNLEDISIPEAEIEIQKPELENKSLQFKGELHDQGSKFKMPKLGMSVPKLKGPEMKGDITLPETKAEVSLPGANIEASEIDTPPSGVKESPSKFKLPTFKFPKFGVITPNISGEVPDPGTEIKFDGTDMHVSMPHTDADVPEVKAEVHMPLVEIKEPVGGVVIEQKPGVEVDAKQKKRRFSLPKFSFSKPSVKAPDVDVSFKEVKIPEGKVEVEGGTVELKHPECEAQVDGQESKFKKPNLGITRPKTDIDVTLPEVKAEVKLPDVEVKKPSAEVDIKAPEIKVVTKDTDGSPSKFKMPTFKLPKLGVGMPSATVEMPEIETEGKIDGEDMKIPKEVLTVDISAPTIDTERPAVDVKMTGKEQERRGGRFKMPSFGFSMSPPKGPDTDFSLSKKDIDVTLPEVKAEVKLPDVEVKKPSAEVDIKAPEIKVGTKDTDGSPSKFKMPTFKLPKFGVGMPSATVEVTDMEKEGKIDGGDKKVPEEVLTVNISAPTIDTEGPSVDVKMTGKEQERRGGRFKMPSFGFSTSTAKGPDTDLSLSKKDIDVTLPEVKAEVKLPDVEVKKPSAEVDIKAPKIEVGTQGTDGSPSKFKMPTFKLPKLGVGMPSATVEVPEIETEGKIDGGDKKVPEEILTVNISAPTIDTEGPSVDVKMTGKEQERRGGRFKMPSFGFSTSTAKGPDTDLSLSKKDIDVTLPEVKAEVKLPDVEVKKPSAEVDIKAPEIKVGTKDTDGSPSKFKMPTFKLPKFGVGMPSATVEVPDMEKEGKTNGGDIKVPEEVLTVDIAAPSIDIEGPAVDVKMTGKEQERRGGRFKLPSFGFSMSPAKGPDTDLSLSKKEVDVALPEVKAEVKLPDVEVKKPSAEVDIKAPEVKVGTKDTDGSPSKFKMPTFKLPKLGVGMPSATVEVPDMEKEAKIDGGDIKVPEEVLTVDIAAPSIDTEGPSVDMKMTGKEQERRGGRFKLPSFGFSTSTAKGPDAELSLSKKEVDVTLPEVKAEVKLPDVEVKKPSAEVDIKAPEIKVGTKDTDGSPSKFKMPTFKLPKLGVDTPGATIEGPEIHKEGKIDGGDIKIPEEVLTVNIAAPTIDTEGPSVHIKTTEVEQDRRGGRFKLPSFGFSMSPAKGPDTDLSLSKKDIDVTLPEVKAEVKLPDVEVKKPSADVDIKAPEIKVGTKDTDGSPSKFKTPTFKLPKLGVGMPDATVEVPEIDKEGKIDGGDKKVPEEVLTVDIAAPTIDIEGPSVDVKMTGKEQERRGGRFKMPSFGFSMSTAKGPDTDLSLSKKDIDVTLPEVKAEVKLPDVEMKKPSAEVDIKAPKIEVGTQGTDGSPSKFKMPTFKLPKLGVGMPGATVEVPEIETEGKIDGGDIKVPEEILTVNISAPTIDTEGPSVDVKMTGKEQERRGGRFKMPSFGFSSSPAKGPDTDLSLSKKDIDVTLPEVKAEVKLPDVEVKKPSAEVDIKAPEIKIGTKDTDGSPSKFKMPTFKLPKFGVGMPSATVEVPDMETEGKIDGGDIKVPEEILTVNISAPTIDTEGPSVDVKMTGKEQERRGGRFKMPSFGFSTSPAKGPDTDLGLSKKEVDVALPEVKAEVKLPDVEVKKPSAEVDIKAPEIKVGTKDTDGSPSKFKMPTFKLPKFGVGMPSATVEMPDMEKEGKIDGGDIKVPEEVLTVDIAAPSIDTEGPSVDVKMTGKEQERRGGRFKMPSFGFSTSPAKGPDTDLSLSKKDIDVTLPEVKAEVKLPDVEVKKPSAEVDIEAAGISLQTSSVDGSPSKFKLPTLKLPKFGATTPEVSAEVSDMDKDFKVDGTDSKLKEAQAEVKLPDVNAATVSISEGDPKMKKASWTLPTFSFSKTSGQTPEADINLNAPKVDVKLPEAKTEIHLPELDIKESSNISTEGGAATDASLKKTRFSLPKLSFSRQSTQESEVDVNLPNVEASLPEVIVQVKQPEGEADNVTVSPSKMKMPTFTLPKFGGSKVSVEDIKTEPSTDKEGLSEGVKAALPEAKAEVKLPDVEAKVVEGSVSVPDAPPAEFDAKVKRPGWTFPKFSFSRTGGKAAELDVNLETTMVDVATPEIKEEVSLPEADVKASSGGVSKEEPPSVEVDPNLKKTRFSLPRFSFSKPSVKDTEVSGELPGVDVSLPEGEVKPDLNASQKGVNIKLPEVKAEVKLSEERVQELSTTSTLEPLTVTIKGSSVDVTTDVSKAVTTDAETPKSETDGVGLGSPSKFKLPSFKMPRLSFSKPKPEDENIPVDTEHKEEQLEMVVEPQGEGKSPKLTLTSFGEILKTIDVEFDVPKTDKVENDPETTKEVQETDEHTRQQDAKDIGTKQEATKSPERTGWFKFPRFSLSSPTEPKDRQRDEKSPTGEAETEEISPTSSVQSSDAFADVSSTFTSEHAGPSISSPTKITVKYSDPDAAAAAALAEKHGNIIMSTTRTELFSEVPNLPEKITILSSGVSSSSEDTLRLESGKIHVITSNIQATPEAEQAKVLTAVQIQSAGGLPSTLEGHEAASWTVQDLQSGTRTSYERHTVKETSSERSESKETIVITKQITHVFDSSEPISDETASSIQRLRDSVHSEKMKFFDGAKK